MGIQINVHAGKDESSSSVTATGSVQHIITDHERNSFGLSDGALKNAVEAYFGKRPDDAYLHSPTPWDDLYKSYNWPEVQAVLTVKSAVIREITSEPVIIASKLLTNNSNQKATFNAGITDEVSNTTESRWSQTNSVSFTQTINYNVEFLGTGAGGETSLSYSHEWGREDAESKTVTVGSEGGVSVELEPGESVEAILRASRGRMKVRIEYLVSLTGDTAVNYESKYKDHHFWGLNIDNVMRAAKIEPTRTFIEDIEIGYYDTSQIEIVNPTNNTKVAFALV